MAIAERLKRYLDLNGIYYRVHELPKFGSLLQAAAAAQVPPTHLIKGVVLKDEIGLVMVVVPATHSFNLDALGRLLHRRVAFASEQEVRAVFRDCQGGLVPPVGEAYGVRSIVDDSIMSLERVYFAAGDDTHVVELRQKDFLGLVRNAWLAADISEPLGEGVAGEAGQGPRFDLRERLGRVEALPAMPETARRIFALRADPETGAEELAEVVELDPSLAAQVLRYARSPFFSYAGKVDSVRTAISRVLGYEMVMNLALGIALARPFKIPALGPLGLNSFWRHAIYSAALAQGLAREMPRDRRPPAGLAYLSGLLHNFGFLVLGHLFRREFCTLANLVGENPDTPLTELERGALGIGHGELGAYLLEHWNLPPELIVAVREHHREGYRGEHAVFAHLCLVADRILKGHGLGEAEATEVPPASLELLGLSEVQTVMVMGRVLAACEGLNIMARQLAA